MVKFTNIISIMITTPDMRIRIIIILRNSMTNMLVKRSIILKVEEGSMIIESLEVTKRESPFEQLSIPTVAKRAPLHD